MSELPQAKTSHFYLRNRVGHRIGVVAMRLEPDDDPKVRVACSLCHSNDQWSSTKGIAAAHGRLEGRNAKRTDNIALAVARRPRLRDLLFSLKPHGVYVREAKETNPTRMDEHFRSEIDWEKMQKIFEHAWSYLTTAKPKAAGSDASAS